MEPLSLAKEIKDRCLQFVRHFHVTHYVSAIKLGAAEYATVSERKFMKGAKLSGNFGLDEFATFRSMASKSSQRSKGKCERWTIGTIMREKGKSAHVPRSVENEAVIDVEIKPIYHLVRHAFLGQFLKEAVQRYISEQRDPRCKLSTVVMHTPME